MAALVQEVSYAPYKFLFPLKLAKPSYNYEQTF